ncbi:hypothetical protein PHET_05811 [Paragonimus heterotremus]|uniref:Uncharacterized protein n=1 Tax=Paragonimus heterotremus TaxID=100268 RepID=A0A8J4TKF4_9TREM|nr:hypothetical protein PHET_05811 [Paragonimus heterotremus]
MNTVTMRTHITISCLLLILVGTQQTSGTFTNSASCYNEESLWMYSLSITFVINANKKRTCPLQASLFTVPAFHMYLPKFNSLVVDDFHIVSIFQLKRHLPPLVKVNRQRRFLLLHCLAIYLSSPNIFSYSEQRLLEVLKNRTSLSDEDIRRIITELRNVPGPIKNFFVDELAKRFNLPSDVVQTLRGLVGGAGTCRVGSLVLSALVMYHLLVA